MFENPKLYTYWTRTDHESEENKKLKRNTANTGEFSHSFWQVIIKRDPIMGPLIEGRYILLISFLNTFAVKGVLTVVWSDFRPVFLGHRSFP